MTKNRGFWEANFLFYELILSILLTFIFIIWCQYFSGLIIIDKILLNNRNTIYGSLSAIFGSLLGFIITTISIIIGYTKDERLKTVVESAHYKDLWNVYKSSIRFLAFATISALFGLIFDRDTSQIYFSVYLNFFMILIIIFRLGRSIWALENIISIITP
jgi:hypothetical protein